MKFLNFLDESAFANVLTMDAALEILKSKCTYNYNVSIKKNIVLYKGDRKLTKDFYFLDKTTRKKRKSANTNNYYTIMLSEIFKSWSEYPKRNLGIICTNDMDIANGYGNVYVIIPFDNAKIGKCPEEDFWFSFKIINPETINMYLHDLGIPETKTGITKFLNENILDYQISVKDTPQKNYACIIFKFIALANKGIISDIENVYNKLTKFNSKFREEFNNKYNQHLKNLKFYTILENYFSPVQNNFQLVTFDKIKTNTAKEIWFDDSAIAINLEAWNKLKNIQ